MEVLHPRCAGLDVHKDSVVACARVASETGVEQQVKTFGTTTTALLDLSEWLTSHGVTNVAMEATGVYWQPVWHILEGSFELVLANAMHIKNVPGRKTDVNDATWIADLLAHGLIRGSFVPPTSTQELRALTRMRKQLVRERASYVLRIQKTLEDANIKVSSVLSDVLGRSGRSILDAIVAGEADPEKLVLLVDRRVKAPRDELIESLRGRVTKHHRFMLELHLSQVDALEKALAKVDTEVGERLDPFRAKAELLTTIPGVSDVVASVILAEIGTDMGRFPTASHLVSWAGLCPKSDESAGKRRSTRLRKGAPWLKTVLVQASWAAARAKTGYLRAQFLRLRSRRGPKKAIMAVASSMLTAAYHILKNNLPWKDLGADHFDRSDRDAIIRRHLRKLRDLGYPLELTSPSV
jgi:transposase